MNTNQERAAENLIAAFKRCVLGGLEPRGIVIDSDSSTIPQVGVVLEHGGNPCHTSIAIIPLEAP